MNRIVAAIVVCLLSFLFPNLLFSQQNDVLQYVNPFIGTAKSNVYTRWGNEGGTYPGAVAPWGYIQLTPQTRSNGYDYNDSSIHFFSCLQHHSGFPGGSAGRLHIMPLLNKDKENCSRSFSHQDEEAKPGYYKVTLKDNNTTIEATATTHAGWFRITFPAHVVPLIFVNDVGDLLMRSPTVLQGKRMNAVIQFDKAIADMQKAKDGYQLTFASSDTGRTIIQLQMSASSVGYESSEQNIKAELSNHSFDDIRRQTEAEWKKQLSVVSVNDTSIENKTIFYTALYHSLLLPWIISDVNGNYKGQDGQIHAAKEKNEYGGFSPWDTFRSLHPLLSLLYPDRQKDMLSSMLDVYKQSGYLPVESMTGNHSIPIIVDCYLKGIKPADSLLLYKAMKKSIITGPFLQTDMSLYQQGFIPYPHTESVTRTVEYTYDDWALAQYSKEVMHDDSLSSALMKRSRNYQNLFNADELSLLPRSGNTFFHGIANAGYKEGDQWVYSLFLPHFQRNLINLLGGDDNFIQSINKAFEDRRLVFDNETMFQVPYLFNSTSYPYKTQECVHAINKRFSATPGGLPGNDDLGATSSWFVWSALGLYPVCPGNPVYAIGTPLFQQVKLFLPNGNQLQISADNISQNNFYIKNIKWNGQVYNDKWMSHKDLVRGGELTFNMDSIADKQEKKGAMPNETDSAMDIHLSAVTGSTKTVKPDELFWITFTIHNAGSEGTAIIKLYINDSITLHKNCFIHQNETKKDSIACRLYNYGSNKIQLENSYLFAIEVVKGNTGITLPHISGIQVSPLVKMGKQIYYHYIVKNISGETQRFVIPISFNNKVMQYDTTLLHAGDSATINHKITAKTNGFYQLKINEKSALAKVYSRATDALILNLPGKVTNQLSVNDISGFSNDGHKAAFENYIELPHTASLDSNGTALTMMAWVYDMGTTKSYAELIAKGDNHVLQLADGKSLTFFAGGWGRGDCTVPLPNNWRNHWHHIAGVCNGKDLRVYIDGKLAGITPVEEMINLNVAARWTIGSNEEFPLDRTFGGKIENAKIYAASLSAIDITGIYKKEKAEF